MNNETEYRTSDTKKLTAKDEEALKDVQRQLDLLATNPRLYNFEQDRMKYFQRYIGKMMQARMTE